MSTAASSRDRIARHRSAQRARGLRPVVLWLPNVNDAAYRARLDDECRRLAVLSRDETDQAEGYRILSDSLDEWR